MRSATAPASNGEPSPLLPEHAHGSAYYRDLGCPHPLCVAAKTAKKRDLRKRRKVQRDRISGRMVSRLLAPVDSELKARHGTTYGYGEFYCRCRPCSRARSGQVVMCCLGVLGARPLARDHDLAVVLDALSLAGLASMAGLAPFAASIPAFAHAAVGLLLGAWAFALAVLLLIVAVVLNQPAGRHHYRAIPQHHQRRVTTGGGYGITS